MVESITGEYELENGVEDRVGGLCQYGQKKQVNMQSPQDPVLFIQQKFIEWLLYTEHDAGHWG